MLRFFKRRQRQRERAALVAAMKELLLQHAMTGKQLKFKVLDYAPNFGLEILQEFVDRDILILKGDGATFNLTFLGRVALRTDAL